jgi:hypothetical protein
MRERAPSNTSPLIRSSAILRGFATVITLSSLGGMTAFAATHVQNAAAPLAPSAAKTTTTAAIATPAPTSTATTRRSTTLTSGVATTTTTARTKTKQS